MAPFDWRRYARDGAEVRLAEIAEEARSILSAFPELHRGDLPFEQPTRVRGRSLSRPREAPAKPGDGNGHLGTMDDGQRNAASGRMKKSRAERRTKPRG